MRSVISLVGGGAAAIWQKIPTVIKVPFVMGIGVLAMAELNKDVNDSWRSGRIFEGQASQGDAQAVDVQTALSASRAGRPIPAASAVQAETFAKTQAEARERLAIADAATESQAALAAKVAASIATSTEALRDLELQTRSFEARLREAEARAKTAEADSMTESEGELLGKLKRGIKLTSTENLRLSEIRRMRAEATTKEADAFAAVATAITQKKAAEWGSQIFDNMGNGGQGTARAMSDMRRQIFNGR
jgi:hypothetical protein